MQFFWSFVVSKKRIFLSSFSRGEIVCFLSRFELKKPVFFYAEILSRGAFGSEKNARSFFQLPPKPFPHFFSPDESPLSGILLCVMQFRFHGVPERRSHSGR